MKDTRERYVTPSQPFSESQIATALAMRAEGATLEAICKRLHCGHTRLTRQIPALSGKIEKRKGLPVVQSNPLTDDEKAEIRRLKAAGLSVDEIGRRIGRDRRRFAGYLERIAEQEIAPLPNVAGPRRFVNSAMTEPLREKPWTPPRG